jgi:hypothetical protein
MRNYYRKCNVYVHYVIFVLCSDMEEMGIRNKIYLRIFQFEFIYITRSIYKNKYIKNNTTLHISFLEYFLEKKIFFEVETK